MRALTLQKAARRALAQIPGSKWAQNRSLSEQKRELERQLRANGWSRSAAKLEVRHRLGHAKP